MQHDIIHPQIKNELSFEPFLKKEYRYNIDPTRPYCKAFLQGHCPLGNSCPDKHFIPYNNNNNKIVCKHWLRGLCKKAGACEFLHEYNLRKMPECTFFSRNGYCTQSPDCLYLHIDPKLKIPPCIDYLSGFCKSGENCKNRHIKISSICQLYLTGFCPYGVNCPNGGHAKIYPMPDGSVPDRLRIKPDDDDDDVELSTSNQQEIV